jgi:Ca2+-binding EF-hand superfamily protein
MQIPSTSTAYGGGEAHRLLNLLLQRQAKGAGQDLPSAAPPGDASGPAAAAPSGGGPGATRFASTTLASLLSTQEGPPSSADIAAKVISAADTDGDGALSLDEVSAALGKDPASGPGQLGQAFAKLDANGDGKISSDELTGALDARRAAGGQAAGGTHHAHHHHHAQPTSADLAAKILDVADANSDGKLSADEIVQALGSGSRDQTGLSQSLARLDTSGDGQLDASELEAAIDAFRTAHRQGATPGAPTSAATVTA